MNTHTTQSLDTLGHKLGEAALTLLVRLYPEVRQATTAQMDAACAAMPAQSAQVIDWMLEERIDNLLRDLPDARPTQAEADEE